MSIISRRFKEVNRLEDVLNIYQIPYNPRIPIICIDEKPIQLLDEIRERFTAKPLIRESNAEIFHHGTTEKIDYKYEAFDPKTAFRLAQKFDFHYTPLHGSWLNIAESELASLALQALGNRRINSIGLLNEILSAWQSDRNSRQKGVNWQFTADDARVKLKRLYPSPIF
jgi:hypothetical protein